MYGDRILKNYLTALRPKQWIKNLLVVAAPLAAGIIQEQFIKVFFGVLAFCFASSLGYLVNDWRDRDLDKLHPTKSNRLFASSTLSKTDFSILITGSSALIVFFAQLLPISFSILLFIYLLVSLSYSFGIKNFSIVEIIFLSSGFLIRALAGSALIGEPPTGWFVISVFFGSIFVVSTKRLAEKIADYKFETRSVLKSYSTNFLGTLTSVSLGVTLVTYSLWVFQIHPDSVIAQFSIIPFTFILFTYAQLAEKSHGESPEELFLRNVTLVLASFMILLSLVWVTYFE